MGRTQSKRYRACLEKIPAERISTAQAVEVLHSLPRPGFDPTVEVVMHLGIDPRQADQAIRGAVALPHGLGTSRKVVAFCEGEDAEKATAAGAIEVGSDELVQKIQDGWTDFDVAIATPAMMKTVSRLGRVLGPQGKMPSPKSGTVVPDVATAVQEFVAGKVEYRNDEGGNVQAAVGKLSFEAQQLRENIDAFLDHIRRLRPAAVKGAYIRRACVATTMSPSIDLQVA